MAALARFKHNGKLDDTFGDHGKVEKNLPGQEFRPGGIAIDRKNGIVDAGGAKRRFALARFVG